jgi:hypothetical protein
MKAKVLSVDDNLIITGRSDHQWLTSEKGLAAVLERPWI